MNSDRCYHVPTSPGQTVCTCLDYAMWLRFVIQTQAEYIADLERRMQASTPQLITPTISGPGSPAAGRHRRASGVTAAPPNNQRIEKSA